MNSKRRGACAVIAVAASFFLIAGCASTGGTTTTDGRVGVVTSTDVYGQIVEQIGGEAVEVTSVIDSASQDPHSYEATARDQLTVSRAELIVENGGGYDAFMDALIEATGTDADVLTAVEFSSEWPGEGAEDSGDEHEHEHVDGFNEHVWYDPSAMSELAEAIASDLGAIRPDDAETFGANAKAFATEIAALAADLDAVAAAHAGEKIFVTEPVPLYLTDAAALDNVAPDAFSEAVEEGQDVSPATLLESLDLIASGGVRVVIVNAQTGGAETTRVIEAATDAGIPVLEFTETLPESSTYIEWMQQNIDALAESLVT